MLTAAHVVCGEDGRVLDGPRVRLLHDGRDRQCRLAWRATDDLDVAVLEIVHEADHGRVAPARWGVFVGTSSGNHAESSGFPWAQESAHGWRDSEQVRLTVNLGTGRVRGMLSGDLDGPVPDRRPDGLRWGGMSGSAVRVTHPDGDLVTGVIVEEAPRYGAQRLTIVPVDAILDDPRFRALVHRASGSEPLAEPAELAGLLDSPIRRPALSPASLLRADSEVVGFHGRQQELRSLHDWCAGDGFSARLVIGPGGQGKSRLARQLAAELGADGWVVGFVGESFGDGMADRQMFTRLQGCGRRLLVVADYAEMRPNQIAELVRHSRRPRARIRLLLLARSADDWWNTLRSTSHDVGQALASTQIDSLPDLEDEPEARTASFRRAVRDLALGLERLPGGWAHRPPDQAHPPDLNGERHGSPLGVQMAALAALLGAVDSPHIKASGEPLSAEEVILDHEARYWRGTAEVQAVPLTGNAQRWAVAAAVLCGAADEEEGVALLGRLLQALDLPVHDRPTIAWWLRSLYPTTRRFWGSLQPDRLGEYLVASVMTQRPRLVPALLHEASTDQSTNALTVLARAAQHRPDVAAGTEVLLLKIPRLAPDAVTVATRSPSPAVLLNPVIRLMEDDQPFELLGEILNAVPQETTALLSFAVRSAELYVQVCELKLPSDPDRWMSRLVNGLVGLGKRQTDAGRHDLGAQTTQRAVTLCRRLPVVEEAVRFPLVLGLNNLGAAHLESGGETKALTVLQQAAALSADYADSDDEDDVSLRSMVVYNLGTLLAKRVRHQEALGHLREAQDCLDTLVQHHQHSRRHPLYQARLARTTVDLANCLAVTGEGPSVLPMALEAVAVLRRLADDDPDAHHQGMAVALTRLAGIHAALGQTDRTAPLLFEARAVLQELSVRDEPHHLPRLSLWWQLLCDTYADIGDHKAALDAAGQSVQVLRRYADAGGHAEPAALVQALTRLHGRLIALGRIPEALEAADEAYTLSDGPAAEQPDGLERLAGLGLARIGLLETLNRPHEGHVRADHLITRLRAPVAHDPARFSELLAEAEYRAARCLARAERLDEAVTQARTSTERLAALADTDQRHRAGHLTSLHRLLGVLTERPRGDTRDLPLLQQTLATCRALRRAGIDDPQQGGETEFAEGLNRLAQALAGTGLFEEALDLTREAVEIIRSQAATDAAEHTPHLARLVHNLSNRLVQADLQAEALEAIDEAVALRSELAADDPDAHTPSLANSLATRVGLRANNGRVEDALADAVKASELYLDNPAAMDSAIAQGLTRLLEQLAVAHLEASLDHEAITAASRAACLHRAMMSTDRAPWLRMVGLLYIAAVRILESCVDGLASVLRALNVADQPAMPLPEAGHALLVVSSLLQPVGHLDAAQAVCAEAIAVERLMATQSGTTATPTLARTLNQYSVLLAALGRRHEALSVTEEVVQMYEALPAEVQARVRPEQAMARYNFGLRNSETGRLAEAVAASAAAVDDYRHLALNDPQTYEPELADALIALGAHLKAAKANHTEIMAVLDEVADLRSKQTVTGEPPL